MKYIERFLVSIAVASLLLLAASLSADEYDGTVRVGYLYLDREGDQSVNQSTFNLYQGLEISLERFSYLFDNGVNLSANIDNAALENRNLSIGATKTGRWGIGFTHNSYRRQYGFDGETKTKRHRSGGQIWWRARPWLKVFGGVGLTKKTGDMLALFDPQQVATGDGVDYAHWFYNAGFTVRRARSTAQVEYRGSTFTDNEDLLNDRNTQRFRASASVPIPAYENLLLNGGYQYYRVYLESRPDTLRAHTLWGGARLSLSKGYSVRYSFIFDRARRTGDLAETDNITHAFYAGKSWVRRGGVTVGYRYRMKDDVSDELTGNAYFVTVWFKPITDLKLRAGYGSEDLNVDEGQTLTGNTERRRGWLSARYQTAHGWARLSLQSRQTDNDEIGSSAEYMRLATDLSVEVPEYATLVGSYSYGTGEYTNSSGEFEYNEHIIKGDVTSREYKNTTVGFGGTYLRSRRDLDIEGFSVRFTGQYKFEKGWGLRATYSSHNFDNFNDPSPVYTEYYTDNVVQISLSYDL